MFVIGRGCRRCVTPRWGEGARRVGRRQVKLVRAEENSLGQVQRAVIGGRDRDDQVGPVQRPVGVSQEP